MITDVLLALGLTGVALEALLAVSIVYWTRYLRPRYMVRWAVRTRAEMSLLESVMWLAARRGRRTFISLALSFHDELSPKLRAAHIAMQRLAHAFSTVEPLVRPGVVTKTVDQRLRVVEAGLAVGSERVVTCVTCEQVLSNGACANSLCPGYQEAQ